MKPIESQSCNMKKSCQWWEKTPIFLFQEITIIGEQNTPQELRADPAQGW